MQHVETYDAVVVGGGPAGATAAETLARAGRSVLLLDRAGRIKPCGGAIPPRLIKDFAIPDELLVARARSARMIAPSSRAVDMPIDNGFVGMVDREVFDEWLRQRAAEAGATRRTGRFEGLSRDSEGVRRPSLHRGFRAAATCSRPLRDRRRRRQLRRRPPLREGRGTDAVRLCLSRDRPLAGGWRHRFHFRSGALRRHLRRRPVAGFLQLDLSARRHHERRHRHRPQGIFPARCGWPAARGTGSRRRRDDPPRRRADSVAAVAAMGQRPRCRAGRRCRGRGSAGFRGRHLLCHGGRPPRRRGGGCVVPHRQSAQPAQRPQALHAGAWPGVPDFAVDAAFLVCERPEAGTLCQHLP